MPGFLLPTSERGVIKDDPERQYDLSEKWSEKKYLKNIFCWKA